MKFVKIILGFDMDQYMDNDYLNALPTSPRASLAGIVCSPDYPMYGLCQLLSGVCQVYVSVACTLSEPVVRPSQPGIHVNAAAKPKTMWKPDRGLSQLCRTQC